METWLGQGVGTMFESELRLGLWRGLAMEMGCSGWDLGLGRG